LEKNLDYLKVMNLGFQMGNWMVRNLETHLEHHWALNLDYLKGMNLGVQTGYWMVKNLETR